MPLINCQISLKLMYGLQTVLFLKKIVTVFSITDAKRFNFVNLR